MNQVQKAKEALQKSPATLPIEILVKRSLETLGQALPKHMSAERLVRIALTTLRMNPDLYLCTPQSFMGALFQSAQLGLEPNVEGQAYIIPFNNKRKVGNEWKTVKEAQFQIGYKGYVELFYRHKSAVSIDFHEVRDGDFFEYEYGTNQHLFHKPGNGEGDVTHYYAIARLNSASIFKVMTKKECIEHGKKHAPGQVNRQTGEFESWSNWVKEVDSMCLKTVLKQLMKLLPKSFELQRAIASDETIKTKLDPDMFTVKDETNWEEAKNDSPQEMSQAEIKALWGEGDEPTK